MYATRHCNDVCFAYAWRPARRQISLVAPFNSALPVFQFFVTTFVLRDESQLPARKVFGVFVVCACSFWLARSRRAPGATNAPLLPPGAVHVLLCCAIWSVVTKFDQLATKAAGSPVVYVCWAKLLTGIWAAGGSMIPTLLSSSSTQSSSQRPPPPEQCSSHRRPASPSRPARKSPRRAGPPVRLGTDDSLGTGADRRWASAGGAPVTAGGKAPADSTQSGKDI